MRTILKKHSAKDVLPQRRSALDPETLDQASLIVNDVRCRGEEALREYAARFEGLSPEDTLVQKRAELEAACATISPDTHDLLIRTAERIRRFAEVQRACLRDLSLEIPGGAAGHTIQPLQTAGCYVPGGRYPLVSSMLMTAVTARAAGVPRVWAASPQPSPLMQAAACVAGIDALITVGGAHAIAALAYGIGPAPACDIIVGPGNRWVTAAKYIVSSDVRIDMLAGPSELLVLCDHTGDPAVIAADLLAQAEHDADACPMLVTTSPALLEAVNRELARQLDTLPTRATALEALDNGFAICVDEFSEAVKLSNEIAPEHLELRVKDAGCWLPYVRNCGCLFIGAESGEVLGDYGAGPNHTLPTGGTARFTSGLSVLNFLRHYTWMRTDAQEATELLDDAVALARIEGLEAHARSAVMRRPHAFSRDCSCIGWNPEIA